MQQGHLLHHILSWFHILMYHHIIILSIISASYPINQSIITQLSILISNQYNINTTYSIIIQSINVIHSKSAIDCKGIHVRVWNNSNMKFPLFVYLIQNMPLDFLFWITVAFVSIKFLFPTRNFFSIRKIRIYVYLVIG